MRFWLRYPSERLAWQLGTALREWACVSAGGSHNYLSDHPEDVCIVCGHDRTTPPEGRGEYAEQAAIVNLCRDYWNTLEPWNEIKDVVNERTGTILKAQHEATQRENERLRAREVDTLRAAAEVHDEFEARVRALLATPPDQSDLAERDDTYPDGSPRFQDDPPASAGEEK